MSIKLFVERQRYKKRVTPSYDWYPDSFQHSVAVFNGKKLERAVKFLYSYAVLIKCSLNIITIK